MLVKQKKEMITWNIDLDNYTFDQLHKLLLVVEIMDSAIANELSEYLFPFVRAVEDKQ